MMQIVSKKRVQGDKIKTNSKRNVLLLCLQYKVILETWRVAGKNKATYYKNSVSYFV